jgi:hypothetical protein
MNSLGGLQTGQLWVTLSRTSQCRIAVLTVPIVGQMNAFVMLRVRSISRRMWHSERCVRIGTACILTAGIASSESTDSKFFPMSCGHINPKMDVKLIHVLTSAMVFRKIRFTWDMLAAPVWFPSHALSSCRINRDEWLLRFTDISVPSQHTLEGKRYAAEVVMSHVLGVNKTDKEVNDAQVDWKRSLYSLALTQLLYMIWPN